MSTSDVATSAPVTRLERHLTLWPLVLFGLAYISPFIVLTTFGVFSETSKGTLASSYLFATIAMIFTAFSYGKLARLYPVSGSAYAYASRTIDSRVGFMVGWTTMLDYFFLPMVVWLIGTAYLHEQFPAVPTAVFLLAFILITTVTNLAGISLASNVNLVLISYQMLILVIFVGLSLARVAGGSAGHGFTLEPFWNHTSTLAAVSAGAAMTAYSFIGFDAVSTFAEETKDPTRTVPRAIVMTATLAGVIFVAVSYVVQLVHPGGTFGNADSAAHDIARQLGGDFFAAVFLATVIMAQLTAGIPIQAAGARLMYAMGRDGALPKRFFGYLHPTRRTPALNIILTGCVGLIALFLSVSSSTSFINFGAFSAFAFVNISVIAVYRRARGTAEQRPVLGWVVMPSIGLLVVLWLMTHLSSDALILGAIWLVLGLAWLAYLTHGFRQPPPHIDFEE